MLINVDGMIFEMLGTMKNNFSGTPKQRFKHENQTICFPLKIIQELEDLYV